MLALVAALGAADALILSPPTTIAHADYAYTHPSVAADRGSAVVRGVKKLSGAKDAAAALEIVPKKGPPLRVPAEAGKEARLPDPALTIKILRVFGTLSVRGRGDVVDMPGPPRNRALRPTPPVKLYDDLRYSHSLAVRHR